MFNKHSFSAVGNDIKIERSTFDMPFRHLTTGNFGDIIPFYCAEVMPGDTFDVKTSLFCRMSTPRYPVMDSSWIDTMYFFVPSRLVWDHFAEFLGENKYSAWAQTEDYIIPHGIVVPVSGDVYDHFQVPTYDDYGIENYLVDVTNGIVPHCDINILPIRAYWLIYNEWFRNENTDDPILVNTTDEVTLEEVNRYRTLAKASKPFDAFTACLPAPQKGDSVTIGVADIPVVTTQSVNIPSSDAVYPLRLSNGLSGNLNKRLMLTGMPADVQTENPNIIVDVAHSYNAAGVYDGEADGDLGGPLNLVAKTSGMQITVNQMREAFALQRILEVQSRCGSRAIEIVSQIFGCESSDLRYMRPAYLGGSKAMIQMQQVTQNAPGGDDQSPLGRLAAFSKTISTNRDFVSSFTEHGYIIGVCVARHKLSYQQGLPELFQRRGKYSIYWPPLAHIGEQPVKKSCIFYTGTESDDDVFGYQEAWWSYRHMNNAITGRFRSTVSGNLDEWHYGDVYDAVPTLSTSWMQASSTAVDRTLDVSSTLHPQLLFDIQVDCKATRPMPLYSTPGLIDHF